MALAAGAPMTAEYGYYLNRVVLADRFGWTLDYIDGMDTWEVRRTLLILDARDRAHAWVNRAR